VLTEVTFKVLPRAERQLTLALVGLDPAHAGAAMTAAMASPLEVSAAAYLPARVAARSAVAEVATLGAGVVLLRLEHFTDFLPSRAERLAETLLGHGETRCIEDAPSSAIWAEIRDVRLLAEPPNRAIWRISTAPAAGTALHESLAESLGAEAMLDWSGGLVWLAVDAAEDAGAAVVRQAVKALGGHATLVRAPAGTRAAVDVFEPPSAPILTLTRRLKESFDAARILNPGRMYTGI
jgi:glycolate oxidase FAD binding subunit